MSTLNVLFGYGSIINPCSRQSTLSKPNVPAVNVRLLPGFGHIRSWCFRSTTGFTALGIEKAKPGQEASINGVLFPVCMPLSGSAATDEPSDMSAFDEREVGYTRTRIDLAHIELDPYQAPQQQSDSPMVMSLTSLKDKLPFSSQSQHSHAQTVTKQLIARFAPEPEEGAGDGTIFTRVDVWVYVPALTQPPSQDYPLVQSYIDTVYTYTHPTHTHLHSLFLSLASVNHPFLS